MFPSAWLSPPRMVLVFFRVLMDLYTELICWNIRGLNDPVRRKAIREYLSTFRARVVCLLETKMAVIDYFIVMQCLGPSFDGFVYLPASDTRGGILVA